MDFKEGYKLKIGQHVEQKGKFNYLSWTFAVKSLRENWPEATWIIHENSDGCPYFKTPKGYMVKISVFIDGLDFSQWHPILNYQNKPIDEPNSFEINTAIQRGLTKAIALATGIGLGLYAGEDLPQEIDETKFSGHWVSIMDENSENIEQLEKWFKSIQDQAAKSMSATERQKFYDAVKDQKTMLEEKAGGK